MKGVIMMKYSSYCYNMLSINETGVLKIQVLSSIDNKPVPNTLIRISKVSYFGQFNENAEGVVLAKFYTDNNGMIITDLPPLNELISDNNDFYIASVLNDQYHNAYIFYIQVYPNISSSYIVYLAPITEEIERFSFIIQPRTSTVQKNR